MLTHFENGIIVFAPFVLPQKELIYYSGKTNGVMPADVELNPLKMIYNEIIFFF